jgi:two-component system, OmpR family, response regulator
LAGSAKVLVVDDEAYITDLVGTALGYEGFAVAVAGSGHEAIAMAGTFRPDLIVLDVMLPDLDGLDVCRRLRAEGERVPVVFLTARDAAEDAVAGLTVGGDDYVTKPFSLQELVARIRAVLRRVRPRRPAA